MKIWKCAKLEFMLMGQLPLWMLGFIVVYLAVFLGLDRMEITTYFCSLFFIFITMSVITNNFFVQTEFTTLLPVKVQHRVYGRFLFGALAVTAAAVMGCIVQLALMYVKHMPFDMSSVFITAMLLGAGLFAMAVEYLVFYLCRISNPQVLNLVRLIPAFVLFFGVNGLVGEVQENEELQLMQAVQWFFDHLALVAALLLGIGILATIIGAVIAGIRENRKY